MRLHLFGKIAFIIFLIQAIYGVIFFFQTIPYINDKHHELEKRVGIELVNKIEAEIKIFSDQLKQYEKDAMANHKNEIKNIVDAYAKSLKAQIALAKNENENFYETKKRLLEATRSYIYNKDDYVFIMDSKVNMLSHPDKKLYGTNQANLQDVNGLKVLDEIRKLAKQSDNGYISYYWHRLDSNKPVEKIAYYRYIPELDWIVVTGVYVDDVKEEVKNRKELFINILRGTISKTVIGKKGYMYVFDNDCRMLIHPIMKPGMDFSALLNPGVSKSICQDLKNSVVNGSEELFYKWDKPTDKGNYVYDKVSWVRYNKDFGLYLVSSAYFDDINESSENIKELIELVLLGVLIISTVLSFFFVRVWLTRPIDKLVKSANKIKDGDLDATCNINSRDEFEMLSNSFNDMAMKLNANMSSLQKTMQRLEVAQQKALQASEAKSNFLANMSHEIRTPMNAVIGMSNLALKSVQDEKTRDYIQKALNSSKLLLGIINDILDFSKIEAGKLDIEKIPFDIKKIFKQVEDMFGFVARQKGFEFRVNLDEEVPHIVVGDPLRTSQIINNLISNAIKFTENGYVEVGCKVQTKDENAVLLEFRIVDTGKGISKEKLDNLFVEFSQEDASTSRMYGGTGLGLTICKKLTELLGGEIWATSIIGEGTTFSFTIPFTLSESTEDDSGESDFSPQAIISSKIMIIDDDINALEVIEESLEHFSFELYCAKSSDEALLAMQQAEFDLLFIDWDLPDMNGIELFKQIKEAHPAVKAFLISVHDDKVQKEDALKAGFEGFLPKPIDQSLLLESVLNAVGRKGVYKKEATQISDAATKEAIKDARVLLAEDNAINREVAQEFLSEMVGTIEVAVNGREAVDMVLGKEPDYYHCVLMDIQMPIMDGYTASKLIRKDKRFATLPILAMTANAMKSDVVRCIANGMNDHIPKPFNEGELYGKLAFWIVRQSGLKPHSSEMPIINEEPKKSDEQIHEESVDIGAALDTEAALERIKNKKKLYKKMLKLFLEEKTGDIEKIRAQLAKKDKKEVEMTAHSLKGVGNSIGAFRLAELAKQIEKEIRSGEMVDEEKLTKGGEEMSQLLKEIEEYLQKDGGDNE